VTSESEAICGQAVVKPAASPSNGTVAGPLSREFQTSFRRRRRESVFGRAQAVVYLEGCTSRLWSPNAANQGR
jgi:hypothetical protein